MHLKSGLPYSLIRYGLLFNYPKLEEDVNTDVLVIGGGISGALMSYELTRHSIPNVVVDARTIGLGSTCASTSLLQYELDVPLSHLQRQIGSQRANDIYLLCRDAVHSLLDIAVEIGFKDAESKQSLYAAAKKKDITLLKKEYQARKLAGIDLQILTSEEANQLAGIKTSAALLSADAAQVDSYSFTHALHQHNISRGTKVYDRTAITRIEHDPKKIVAYSGAHKITARKIIYATGYETAPVIHKSIARLSSTFVVASESTNDDRVGWNNNLLIWNTGSPYLYMRSTGDRRILVGGRDEKFYSQQRSEKMLDAKKRQLGSDFKKSCPGVEFIPEFTWSGVFASTKDGLPFIDSHPKFRNEYFALGYGGNGITFSLIAARLICRFIRGQKPGEQEWFSFNRS